MNERSINCNVYDFMLMQLVDVTRIHIISCISVFTVILYATFNDNGVLAIHQYKPPFTVILRFIKETILPLTVKILQLKNGRYFQNCLLCSSGRLSLPFCGTQ